MFDHLRKYAKLLMPILLGLFFVTFVIDDYADEPRKMKGVVAECFAEMEADESECEEDDVAEEASSGSYSLIPNGITCIVLGTMQLSSSKQSAEQFRGLVRRYAPRQISTYINLINNGMDLIQVCAIFYFDKYEQIRRKTRDCGTMTCDYDHDSFGQGLKFQHTRGSGHGHGQWSWSNSPEDLRPLSERNNNTLIHKLWTLQAF